LPGLLKQPLFSAGRSAVATFNPSKTVENQNFFFLILQD
jgi:hypothetical protein